MSTPAPHDRVSEQADEAMPDTAPSSAHGFNKESMIIEPPRFRSLPDFADLRNRRFWILLWFGIGRPVLIGGLWIAGAGLALHVALNWSDMPHGVLAAAAAIATLLLLAALRHRFLPHKNRKSNERTHGTEISAFFGTDLDTHRQLRHSKRVDAYFDGTRVGMISEKQAQLATGRLPFATKAPDGRPLRTLNPEGVEQARAAGMEMGK